MVFRLDLGQISFSLVENAFATQQLAPLATSIVFYDILAWVCAEIFEILFLPFLFLLSFLFFFAAVIDLLLGLLAVKKKF